MTVVVDMWVFVFGDITSHPRADDAASWQREVGEDHLSQLETQLREEVKCLSSSSLSDGVCAQYGIVYCSVSIAITTIRTTRQEIGNGRVDRNDWLDSDEA